MILKEEFQKQNYSDILEKPGQFDISYLYDRLSDGNYIRPQELVAAYLSQYGDDLFLILDAKYWTDGISNLCKKWDARLARFSNFGSSSTEALKTFRYNMIQLILYTGIITDQSAESSLDTSRKILLPYSLDNDGQYVIQNSDAIELPFYLVQGESIKPNPQLIEKLKHNIPVQDSELFQILISTPDTPPKRSTAKVQRKIFDADNYQAIEGWLIKYADQ